MTRSFFIWFCLLASLLPVKAFAVAADQIHFSGFASFIAAKSFKKSEPYGDATSSIPYQTELRDYTKLGFRVSVDLHDKLSFTTQILADGKDDFKPEFDWIFLSYHITPDVVLHIGKYVTAYYMYSDYNDISYAYQWLEAPSAVYGTNINKTLEGAKLVWSSSLSSDWASELSLMAGKDKTDLDKVGVEKASLNMRSAFGFAWQVEHDWLAVRTSYMMTRTNANIKNTTLDGQYLLKRMLGENSVIANSDVFTHNTLVKPLNWQQSTGHAASLGSSAHFSRFFAIAEITYSDLSDTIAVGKQVAGYTTVGTYLPDNISLALTLYKKRNQANQKIKSAIDRAVADSNDPVTAAQAGTFLHNNLNAIQNRDREGFILSMRWDFHSQAALKAEYMYEWQTDYSRIPNWDTLNQRERTNPHAARIGVDLAF